MRARGRLVARRRRVRGLGDDLPGAPLGVRRRRARRLARRQSAQVAVHAAGLLGALDVPARGVPRHVQPRPRVPADARRRSSASASTAPSSAGAFRALKLWAVLRCYGAEGLRSRIRESVRLAERSSDGCGTSRAGRSCAPRHFSVVCFRCRASDEENERAARARQRERRDLHLAHQARRAIRAPARDRQRADDGGRCARAWSRAAGGRRRDRRPHRQASGGHGRRERHRRGDRPRACGRGRRGQASCSTWRGHARARLRARGLDGDRGRPSRRRVRRRAPSAPCATRSAAIDVLVAAAGIVPAWTGIRGARRRRVGRGVPRQRARRDAVDPGGGARDRGGGAIVVIASQNAWRGNQNLASYTASKHAALGLVRSVALELGPRGIRVNAIGPGSVATNAYVGRLRRREEAGGLTVDEALEAESLQTPLRRLTTVEDVARATLFLASDLASGVTGHILPVGAPLT